MTFQLLILHYFKSVGLVTVYMYLVLHGYNKESPLIIVYDATVTSLHTHVLLFFMQSACDNYSLFMVDNYDVFD